MHNSKNVGLAIFKRVWEVVFVKENNNTIIDSILI